MSASRFRKLTGEDYVMDCPNPSCEGWLLFFAANGDNCPTFLRCIFSKKKNDGDCNITMIFARKGGQRGACQQIVKRV